MKQYKLFGYEYINGIKILEYIKFDGQNVSITFDPKETNNIGIYVKHKNPIYDTQLIKHKEINPKIAYKLNVGHSGFLYVFEDNVVEYYVLGETELYVKRVVGKLLSC